NASVVLARAGVLQAPPPCPEYDRVVVTGIATLTPGGCSPREVWDAFAAGRVCVQEEDGARIGRVSLDPSTVLTPPERKRVDRLGILALVAARLSLRDAGLEMTSENRERVGVVFGTGVGPMESMEAFSRPLFEEGPDAAN